MAAFDKFADHLRKTHLPKSEYPAARPSSDRERVFVLLVGERDIADLILDSRVNSLICMTDPFEEVKEAIASSTMDGELPVFALMHVPKDHVVPSGTATKCVDSDAAFLVGMYGADEHINVNKNGAPVGRWYTREQVTKMQYIPSYYVTYPTGTDTTIGYRLIHLGEGAIGGRRFGRDYTVDDCLTRKDQEINVYNYFVNLKLATMLSKA